MNGNNSEDPNVQVIGYSAFNPLEACYEYNEDACYIADDEAALLKFLGDALLLDDAQSAGFRHELEPVTIAAMLSDFGCSCREYALEPQAMERFERLADVLGLKYTSEPYDEWPGQPSKLCVVTLQGKPEVLWNDESHERGSDEQET